jgi:endonuclease III
MNAGISHESGDTAPTRGTKNVAISRELPDAPHYWRMARRSPPNPQRVIARLLDQHGRQAPPPADTAFALVLWEKVAYLAPDQRRAEAFEMLRTRVGLTPQAILGAKPSVLRQIAAVGGKIEIDKRVQHMQDAAALVIDEFGGSLDTVLRLPHREAMRALQRFYGIGEPGAERILLLTRTQRLLPLDSNGLRSMVRLGYGKDHKNYSTMYRSVRDTLAGELRDDFDWLIDAHLVLRRHGQDVCKSSAPRCEICSVRDECAHAGAR